MNMQDRVTKFHVLVGHPHPDKPQDIGALLGKEFTIGNGEVMGLFSMLFSRVGFIQEKLDELKAAILKGSTPDTVDALADILVFTLGTFTFLGVEAEGVFHAVMNANMKKGVQCPVCKGTGHQSDFHWKPCEHCKGLGKIIKYRKDGKILKPKDWKHPDIGKVLNQSK